MLLHLTKGRYILPRPNSSMSNKVTSQSHYEKLMRITVLFLMLLYIGSTLTPEQLHSFIHHHEITVTHSADEEQDPCHRTLYHHDTEQGCEHDSHLIAYDDCEGDDQIYHGDYTLLNERSLLIAEALQEHFDFYKVNLDSYWAVISSSRAPPAVYSLACV